MRRPILVILLAASAAACPSAMPGGVGDAPSADPRAARLAEAAKTTKSDVVPDPRSPSRVLAYVDGDVVTYRDVLLRIGPQLAMLESPEERDRLEEQELIAILEDRIVYRAAQDSGVAATRDDVDEESERRLADLKRNGGTLEAFLAERGMTRREYDDLVRRDLVMRRYMLAAIGRSGDARVRVRPETDTYVSPADVEKYYQRHAERFREPAGALCRMLTVKTDLAAPDREKAFADAGAKAKAALERLSAGEDWVPVFREVNSAEAEADPADGLLEMRRGEKAQWIEEFAFGSPKGALSGVIEKGTTLYVLRAEGAHDERTVAFEECQARVRMMLGDLRRRLAGYEVELSLLDEASVQPERLRVKLRDSLRSARLKLLADAGL